MIQPAKSIVWARGLTQFLQEIGDITKKKKKRVNYYKSKEIKEMYQSNALGRPYLDLIQRVNCKKTFFLRKSREDSVLGNIKK